MILATAAKTLLYARSQVGVTENPAGSNRTRYGQAYGLNGEPWCGIFVWWCIDQAGTDLRELGIDNPAYCPTFLSDARDKCHWPVVLGRGATPGLAPTAGDVVFFDWDADGQVDHVGLMTAARPGAGGALVLATIEGNTAPNNGGSQSNGGGVYARLRTLKPVAAILRPPYARSS